MAYPKFPKTPLGQSPRRVTPQQQLWELTNERQHNIFRQVFRRIKKRDQEDLCYGMIAYIRFKIRRPFESPFMQTLFESFIDLVEGNCGETSRAGTDPAREKTVEKRHSSIPH